MSQWSLNLYNTVIPMVSFIRLSNNFPFKKFGSLKPILISAYYFKLTVQQIYTFMLKNKIFCQNLPMHAFVTILKAIIPIKLTINHCFKK